MNALRRTPRPSLRAALLVTLSLLLQACGASGPAAAPEAPAAAPGVAPVRTEEDPIAGSGRRCRSARALECDSGEYCDFPVGAACGARGRAGVCRPRPELCTREYMPVCGCDGRTWPTRCVAASQGVDAASDGACPGDVGEAAPTPPAES